MHRGLQGTTEVHRELRCLTLSLIHLNKICPHLKMRTYQSGARPENQIEDCQATLHGQVNQLAHRGAVQGVMKSCIANSQLSRAHSGVVSYELEARARTPLLGGPESRASPPPERHAVFKTQSILERRSSHRRRALGPEKGAPKLTGRLMVEILLHPITTILPYFLRF